jgi:sugar-specific transcriptional regulator TrmB
MLTEHKSKYEQNAKTLQNSLSNTTRDTTQNIKDAIADFTLQFMNSIDDSTELAERNEEKLTDIYKAASSIPEISNITTWQIIGRDALVAAIKDAIFRVKSSIIIVMPVVIPEVLQVISEYAYQKKAVRFLLTASWEMSQYGPIIQKMMQLGNIQFRQLSTKGEFFALTRDAEEVIIGPHTTNEKEMISVISNQEAYAKLYSQFIGPIFQANSRPIK